MPVAIPAALSASASPVNTSPVNESPVNTSPTSALSTSALESELVGLAGHLAAAHCRWLQLLAEFDDRDGWAGPGLRTCAHWLSWRVGMNLRTAFEQLRVAHALTGLTAVTAAFAAGQISYSKVRAITRVASADTERTLLELALAGTASHVERIVRATRQATADPAETHANRRLEWDWDDDGALLLRARLTPEQGATLLNALARATDHPLAGQPECSAEHSAAPRDGSAPIEPLGARRADALVSLLARSHDASAASSGAQVVLHIDAAQATAQIEKGPAVPLASAERIACAARVRALVKDRKGNPLYLGRTHRLVSKRLLAAVSLRDQHRCRWVGCDETRHLDAHHIRHWLHGGRTDIHNLVLLCDRHHRLIHEHGYSMRGVGTDVTFYRPDGEPIATVGPPTEGRPEAVREISLAHGITITDDTITPTWAGERLDPTPILMLLLPQTNAFAAAA
jgi:hypothetical protein